MAMFRWQVEYSAAMASDFGNRGCFAHTRDMTLARLALTPLALAALVAAAPLPRVTPLPETVRVAMTTTMGTIVLDLDNAHAPITTRNFVAYVDQHRLDGTTFYRVMRLPWGTPPNGIIHGGVRGDFKRVLKPIAHEPTSQTGILHTAGTISMARLAPGTATCDFSILLSDLKGFDAGGSPTDPAGYAAFGRVVEGMDVVRKIYDVPLSPTLGEGFMKGQMILAPVRIVTARRVRIETSRSTAM